MKTPYILALMALLIVLLVIFSLGRKTKVGKPSADISSSTMKAVDFTVKDINGKELLLSNYRGKVVLLDVWATWCGYCVQEMPELVAMQRDALTKKIPLQIIGISVDEDRSLVKPFVTKHQINYPVVFGNEAMLKDFGAIPGLPTKFIIDKDGKVVDKLVGAMPREELEAKLAAYLP